MPVRVIITPGARLQIREIKRYIAAASYPSRAAKYIARLQARIRKLGEAPFQGTARNELGEGIRTTGFERRIKIVFAATVDQVVVVGVYYAGMQPPELR